MYDILRMEEKRIKRFLLDECDYAEAELVACYLREHIEVLDGIDFMEDWEAGGVVYLSESRKAQLYRRIMGRRRSVVFTYRKLAVAACLVGVIVSGLYMFSRKTSGGVLPAASEFADNSFSTLLNVQARSVRMLLPDSTEVYLNPYAAFSYRSDFSTTRDIILKKGEAFFKVFPDGQRPFMVLANGIKTTALGTSFWVENTVKEQRIKVKLTSGKVSVESIGKNFTMKPLYLHPSQECWIDKRTGQVRLVEKKQVLTSTRAEVIGTEQMAASVGSNNVLWTNENLQFSKASLPNVLHKLGSRHHVTIIADDHTIDGMTLTGKILYSDSLSLIIRSICEINDLKYERRNDSIFLKK